MNAVHCDSETDNNQTFAYRFKRQLLQLIGVHWNSLAASLRSLPEESPIRQLIDEDPSLSKKLREAPKVLINPFDRNRSFSPPSKTPLSPPPKKTQSTKGKLKVSNENNKELQPPKSSSVPPKKMQQKTISPPPKKMQPPKVLSPPPKKTQSTKGKPIKGSNDNTKESQPKVLSPPPKKTQPPKQPAKGKKKEGAVYIGNMPSHITEKVLRLHFEPHGHILSILTYPERHYAFVNFAKEEDAKRAVNALANLKIDEVKLKVSLKPSNDDHEEPEKKKRTRNRSKSKTEKTFDSNDNVIHSNDFTPLQVKFLKKLCKDDIQQFRDSEQLIFENGSLSILNDKDEQVRERIWELLDGWKFRLCTLEVESNLTRLFERKLQQYEVYYILLRTF